MTCHAGIICAFGLALAACHTGSAWRTGDPDPGRPPNIPLPTPPATLTPKIADAECWLDAELEHPPCHAVIEVYTVGTTCYAYVPYRRMGVNVGAGVGGRHVSFSLRKVSTNDPVTYAWAAPGIVFKNPVPVASYFDPGQDQLDDQGRPSWVLPADKIPNGHWSVEYAPVIRGNGNLCTAFDPVIGNGKS